MASVSISSVNYNGLSGNITFYPYTGGTTINVGAQTIPYSYTSNYPYGRYDIYFSNYNKTCSKISSPPNNVLPCDILTLSIYTDPIDGWQSSNIRRYDFPSNILTPLSGSYGRYSYDIAHTDSKFWFRSSGLNTFVEYNITSNPWTSSVSRFITGPGGMLLNGLSAIDNTTLLSVNATASPNTIVRINITTTVATATVIASLPLGRQIIGDVTLTSTGKILVTNQTTSGFSNVYLSQYNYGTGAFEGEFSIIAQVPNPEGIFVQNNQIYIINSGGQVYNVMKTSPYTLTYVKTASEPLANYSPPAGVSQRLECVNQHFTFGSWYCLQQCSNTQPFELEPTNTETPIINELPPLGFDFCAGDPNVPKMYLPSGLAPGTIVKGTDGKCYSTIENTGYSTHSVGPIITRYGTNTFASCNICGNRSVNIFVSTSQNIYCNYLGNPSTTYLTYRINNGPWITDTTPILSNHGTAYTPLLNLSLSVGSVIDFYFSGIRWGVGPSGDYTSRCSNQLPYRYTVPSVYITADIYLNIKTSNYYNEFEETSCFFVRCPTYVRPRPYIFRNQTYTRSLYELNYNIPFEANYTLAIENFVWADSNQLVNGKPAYVIPSSDYLSIVSYVWYDTTTNLWNNSTALGGGIIYTTLNSISDSDPESGPDNPWISTEYVDNSTIISSEPVIPIITNDLVLWYDAGSTLTWPGTGTILNDITGNNNGTFYSGGVPTQPNVLPESMNSIQFLNSSNTAISSGNGPTLSGITNVVTVEAWIKPSTFDDGNIFSKNGNQGFRVRIDSTGHIWMLGSKTGPSLDTYTSTGTITLNTWSHIVAVWTSTGYYTYINGVDSGFDLSKTLLVQANTNGLLIGQTSGTQERYSGLGSIFRVYNRALTASEVLANFNSEKSRFGLYYES